MPFQTKICGVRTTADVVACAAAGADCVGLNFYPKSVRYVDPQNETTRSMNTAAADAGLHRVGLFVNESIDRVHEIASDLSLDSIQFHGDETRAEMTRMIDASYPVIRAIRLPTCQITPDEIQAHLQPLWRLPITFLLDADAGGQFGGGGRRLHWPSIAAWADKYDDSDRSRWILAGGLDAGCVRTAKSISTACRVDVASGVESPRGEKSAELIKKFVFACGFRGVDESD